MSDDYQEAVISNLRGRRKKGDKNSWKKTKKSTSLNSGAGKTPKISCKHNNTKLCRANELSQDDIQGTSIACFIRCVGKCFYFRFFLENLRTQHCCSTKQFFDKIY